MVVQREERSVVFDGSSSCSRWLIVCSGIRCMRTRLSGRDLSAFCIVERIWRKMGEERDIKVMGTTRKRRMGVAMFERLVKKVARKERN